MLLGAVGLVPHGVRSPLLELACLAGQNYLALFVSWMIERVELRSLPRESFLGLLGFQVRIPVDEVRRLAHRSFVRLDLRMPKDPLLDKSEDDGKNFWKFLCRLAVL